MKRPPADLLLLLAGSVLLGSRLLRQREVLAPVEPEAQEEPEAKPLATLTAEERAALDEARQVAEGQGKVARMLSEQHTQLWRNLRERYGLPAIFDYEPETGAIYPKAAAEGKAGDG